MARRREWLVTLRRRAGLSQAKLGELVGADRQTVYRWENGYQDPYDRHRPRLAQALGIDLTELDRHENAYQRNIPSPVTLPVPVVASEWSGEQAGLLADTATVTDDAQITPEVAPRLVHEWLVTDPPQSVELHAGNRIGTGLVGQIAHRVDQLRHLDDYVAGTDLDPAVTREVATTATLAREASYTDATGRRLLAVLGDLCQLAGWVAADAGRDRWACHYYATGIAASHAAGDRPLAGQLASTLAYQLANTGQPRDAVLLAQSATSGTQHSATATVRALFLERLAWAYARSSQVRQTERTLAAVEDVYSDRTPEEDPLWAYWLTPEEIDVMAGRCWVELHQPDKARPRLEHALASYGEDRPRETALYTSWLAEAHLQAGNIDQAAELACQVLELTIRTASVRSDDRAHHLAQLLRPHRGVPLVEDFHERYRLLQPA